MAHLPLISYIPAQSPRSTQGQIPLSPPSPRVVYSYTNVPTPHQPRPQYNPLPPLSPIPPVLPPSPQYLFPFSCTASMVERWRVEQLAAIQIPAFTHIYIHDPATHIGEIVLGDRACTAVKVMEYIHRLTQEVLPLDRYRQLSPEMQREVMTAFLNRCWSTSSLSGGYNGRQIWSSFLSGHQGDGYPTRGDLLLGRTQIWGLNPDPITWRWVLYVDFPQVATS